LILNLNSSQVYYEFKFEKVLNANNRAHFQNKINKAIEALIVF